MSGQECCENPPGTSSDGESGEIKHIASLKSYVSGNLDSKLAVLLISDVYGYEAPKLRKIADKLASAGYYAVVPDFFFGDHFIPKTQLQEWLKNHEPKPSVDFAKPVIHALKERGISKIGAAGFCWGAKVVVELAKDADIQVAALLHPTFVTLDDIKGVKVPVAILGAEFDKISPPELAKQFEAALQAKPEVDHFVKIFPGVSHGWTVRYRDENVTAVKSAQEAHQDLVDWFVAKDQLKHVSHHHPLSLVYLQQQKQKNENDSDEDEEIDELAEDEFVEENHHRGQCSMCNEPIWSFHLCYYYCKPCDYSLHKFCAELPEILPNHPLHPQHDLYLEKPWDLGMKCSICNLSPKNIWFYDCFTCHTLMDIICVTMGERKINHSSHHHQLELMPQPIVSSCSACGNKHEGFFFICITCGFCINKDCALLPEKMLIQNHTNETFIHSHPLTLAYSFPFSATYPETTVHECRVCHREFDFHLWIYTCDKCRYLVHVDCATSKREPFMSIFLPAGTGKLHKNFKDDEHPNLLHCPFHDEGDNILKRHMSNQMEFTGQQHDADMLNHSGHHKPLILFNKQTSDGEKMVSLHNPMERIQLLCDGCMKPIMTVPFYICYQHVEEQCCFILHEWCAKLPLKVQDYPGHPEHSLFLLPKVHSMFFSVFKCVICNLPSNGFAYGCKMCKFYIDINCAFIPKEIVHDAHPSHLLYKVKAPPSTDPQHNRCNACKLVVNNRWGFHCPSCKFFIHVGCALLLYRVIKHKCDKHPLNLRYEPVENHINAYFCEICEYELDPWRWFYHCTTCAQSIHAACAPLILQYEQARDEWDYFDESVNKFLNVKFGGTLKIKGHPHRLTFVEGIYKDGKCFKCHQWFKEDMIFKCLECKYMLHYDCASLLSDC
ncbi:hypothetical protein R6Q57_019031 [Mikania cordata]